MNVLNKKSVGIVLAIAVFALLLLRVLSPSDNSATKFSNSSIAMGTVLVETVYTSSEGDAETVMDDITALVNELDTKHLSWRIPGADIYRLNETFETEVSTLTADCIKTCLDVSQKSRGLFDITIGDLSTLWSIGTENARVPTDIEIQDILKSVDYTQVMLSGNTVTIAADQKIDLGAVGKGLACDEIRNYLRSAQSNGKTSVNAAVVSVGGSVLLYGRNPDSDDGTWSVGIRNPFGSADDYAAILNIGECCVSSSGDYEKVLEANGVKYHHILNPATGYPANSNLTGITVVSNSGILSDALSTACFILGYSDEALQLIESYDAEAVFFLKDKSVYTTPGLSDKITITTDEFNLVTK